MVTIVTGTTEIRDSVSREIDSNRVTITSCSKVTTISCSRVRTISSSRSIIISSSKVRTISYRRIRSKNEKIDLPCTYIGGNYSS